MVGKAYVCFAIKRVFVSARVCSITRFSASLHRPDTSLRFNRIFFLNTPAEPLYIYIYIYRTFERLLVFRAALTMNAPRKHVKSAIENGRRNVSFASLINQSCITFHILDDASADALLVLLMLLDGCFI